MKVIRKALLWSAGLEAFSILLIFGDRIGLGFLAYLSLALHFPALCLVDHWPAVRQTLIGPILIQWFIWFVMFAFIFSLHAKFQKPGFANRIVPSN